MEERKTSVTHKTKFDERKQGLVTGVTDVLSFDEKEIVLKTCAGKMSIQGDGLTLTRLDLDLGETDIKGRIDGIWYSKGTKETKKKAKKHFRRWFA